MSEKPFGRNWRTAENAFLVARGRHLGPAPDTLSEFYQYICVCVCVACSPQFRFTDHVERSLLDDEQPKKMLLKRDPDSYEVCGEQCTK